MIVLCCKCTGGSHCPLIRGKSINFSREARNQTHAELYGRGQLGDTEIAQAGLKLVRSDQDCFPPNHHWNITGWPAEPAQELEARSALAEKASEKILKMK
jgi:hypothetical protein